MYSDRMEPVSKKFVLLGSVDAGKSTTCGSILYQTGNIEQHVFEKTKNEVPKQQLWSALLDIYEQERTRGKTQEVSKMQLKWNDNLYELFDCPGHGIYIRSTIEALCSNNIKIMCLLID